MGRYTYNLDGSNNNQMIGSRPVSIFFTLSDCKNMTKKYSNNAYLFICLMPTRNILLANFTILLLLILSMNLHSLNISGRYNSIVSPMN